MSYFAGSGSGKGWNKFCFILTPDELPRIFEGLSYFFVGTGSHTDANYKETPKDKVFSAYEDFYEKILIGEEELSRQQQWQIEEPIRKSIIDDINKVSFIDTKDENGNLTPFRLIDPTEPLINISPFYLPWSEEEKKLSMEYMNEPGIIGLKLSFPKYISFDYTNYIETSEYATALLYSLLVKKIKGMAHKAKIETPLKLYTLNFWISTDAVNQINKNRYLKMNNLRIK